MSEFLHTSKHPLVAAKLSQLREANQTSKVTRELINDLSRLLSYEATTDLPVVYERTLMSPYEPYQAAEIKQRIALIPILRSGLGLVDGFLNLFPDAPVFHLGIYREKISLQPVEYYNKLPDYPEVDLCYVLDPIIATGNTAVATVNILKEWGVPGKNIRFVGVLASKKGINRLQKEHPDIQVYVAGVDEVLDDKGIIRPGVGDVGDRLMNTFF